MKKNIAIILLSFISSLSFAQKKIPFIDVDEVIQSVASSSREGNYEKALEHLNSINKNDSSYVSALVSKTYYLLTLKKYEEAIKEANKGIQLDTRESKLYFYVNKGVGFSNLEKYEEAIKSYNEGIKIYPKNYLLWYNKGFVLQKQNKMNEAIEAYKKTIIFNPYYKKAHLQLGNICYKQQLMAQALMCFNTYLLLDPDSEDAFAILNALNKIVATNNVNEKNENLIISKDDESFESIDMVLNNKIALNDDYVVDNKINISLTKQNHALIAQLADYEGNGGFWDQKYVPIFNWIRKNNLFDEFTYTISYTVKNKDLKKVVDKHVKKITEFISAYKNKWVETIQKNEIVFKGKLQTIYNDYGNNYIEAMGAFDGTNPIGKWDFFNSDGQLTVNAEFDNDGKRHHKWVWYYTNGTIKETAQYVHGKLEGDNHLFHENSKKYIVSFFKNDALDGVYKVYNEYGALTQKKHFKQGMLHGKYLAYFQVGEELVEFDIDYKNDSIYNVAKEFYADGTLFQESFYEKGILQQVKKYQFDGNLYSVTDYANGKLNGPFKKYHTNGKLAESGQNLNDENDGAWKTYHRNGNIENEFTYEKGKLHGLFKSYDKDGKIHYSFKYRKGEIIAYTYYNKEGGIIKEAKKKGGEFMYEGYSPDGNLIGKGLYDVSGGRIGLWKYNSVNGVLNNSGNYIEGKTEGIYTTFFDSGEKKYISNYKNDVQDGYYVEYYKNGTIKTQGWFKEGNQYGEWRDYYVNGKIQAITYYHKGNIHGTQEFYSVEGNVFSRLHHEFGKLVKELYYSKDGNILFDNEFLRNENSYTVTSKHFNKTLQSSYSYVNGLKHGPYKQFDFNGQKIEEGTYKNNSKNGDWISYFPNGNIKSKIPYLNGNANGKSTYYYENGAIKNIDYYEYGVPDSLDISYLKNGNIDNKLPYYYGDRHGRQEFYSLKGKLQLIRFYNYGRLIGYSYLDKNGKEKPMIPIQKEQGKITAYYDNGKVSREMEYFNGKLVNEYKAYYYSGQLENEISFDEGEYHKKYIEYYENGNLKKDTQYAYGLKHGYEKTYHENGKLKQHDNYISNVKSGASKIYNKKGKLIKEVTYYNGQVLNEKSF